MAMQANSIPPRHFYDFDDLCNVAALAARRCWKTEMMEVVDKIQSQLDPVLNRPESKGSVFWRRMPIQFSPNPDDSPVLTLPPDREAFDHNKAGIPAQ
jgi:hypothetical protein